jgi:hypothetical protein
MWIDSIDFIFQVAPRDEITMSNAGRLKLLQTTAFNPFTKCSLQGLRWTIGGKHIYRILLKMSTDIFFVFACREIKLQDFFSEFPVTLISGVKLQARFIWNTLCSTVNISTSYTKAYHKYIPQQSIISSYHRYWLIKISGKRSCDGAYRNSRKQSSFHNTIHNKVTNILQDTFLAFIHSLILQTPILQLTE